MASSAQTSKRVVILGCGYVGSALGQALVAKGHDVIGTTTTPARIENIAALGITPQVLQLSDLQRLGQLLVDRDAVYLTVAAGRSGSYRETYLEGAESLTRAVRGTPVRRIIYTSSTRVYGQQDGSWVDENSPTEPTDEPGQILLDAERVLLAANPAASAERLEVTVVRLSGIYGEGRDPAKRILSLAGSEVRGGRRYVNMIHRDDIAAALVGLLDLRHHGVFTLSDDHPTTRQEFYDRVIQQAGLGPIRWLQDEDPSKMGKRVHNTRIKETLGLTLRHPTH